MSMTEANGSREFTYDGVNSTFQRIYNIRAEASESAAFITLSAAPATATVNDVLLSSRSLRIKPRGKASSGRYLGVVDYRHVSRTPGQDAPENLTDEKLSFSFTMPNPFFTRAISQTDHGADAKDVGVSIGVLEDGTVEGATIEIPSDGFQVSTRIDLGVDAAAANAWIKARIGQLGTTNDDTFRGLEAGDCILRAFSGDQRSDGDFDIVWDFGAVLGEDYTGADSFEAAGETFTIGKRVPGFEYIWVQYEPTEDVANNVVVPKARGVYVAKVFEDSTFNTFGIST